MPAILPTSSELQTSAEDLFIRAYRYAQGLHRSDLVGDISKLWEALTVGRAESLADYFKLPSMRRAYIGYYAPLYAAKLALLMRQLSEEGHLGTERPSVLDLGSGPLVGVMAARLAFGELSDATAVDREIGPMRYGYDFLKTIWPMDVLRQITMLRANLTGPEYYWRPKNAPNLIIMAHVLNEFGAGYRFLSTKLKLVSTALNMLPKNGRMLIVEPANRLSSRELMALRDALVHDDLATIYAPCTGANDCPLLQTATSWCHGELAWKEPELCAEVGRKIGFDKSYLKYSYLLLGKKGESAPQDKWRVVSGSMEAAGVLRRYVCTNEGLLTLSQSAREKEKPLVDLGRGQLLEPDALPKSLVKAVKES